MKTDRKVYGIKCTRLRISAYVHFIIPKYDVSFTYTFVHFRKMTNDTPEN